MKASYFKQSPTLAKRFGYNNVKYITHLLAKENLFPLRKEQVTPKDAAYAIFSLCAGHSPQLKNLIEKDKVTGKLVSFLESILSNKELLKKVKHLDLIINPNFGSAAEIFYDNGKVEKRPGGNQDFIYGFESTRLTKEFLYHILLDLNSDFDDRFPAGQVGRKQEKVLQED